MKQLTFSAAALLLLGIACESGPGGRGGTASVGVVTLGGDDQGGKQDDPDGSEGSGGSDDNDNDDNDDNGVQDMKFDVPVPDGGVPQDDEDECASVVESAMATVQPADIIFVIDNSGSMTFEAQAVQDNMNGFSAQIIASGVDIQVVMISSYSGNGVCVAPPLGGGGCPGDDNNLPTYQHVNQSVGSSNGLSLLLNTHPQWQASMREEASKHIVVVTDDNSNLSAANFDAAFKALDPSYADYKLHGIVSTTNCAQTAAIGHVYISLGMTTGGLIEDLCDQNFQPLFDLLSTEVINGASLSCSFEIPEPPDGGEFDPGEVNIDFDDGTGPQTIGYVESAAACAGVADGWYYDNPFAPTLIVACPQTCERFQDVQSASIDIRFGCATVPAG